MGRSVSPEREAEPKTRGWEECDKGCPSVQQGKEDSQGERDVISGQPHFKEEERAKAGTVPTLNQLNCSWAPTWHWVKGMAYPEWRVSSQMTTVLWKGGQTWALSRWQAQWPRNRRSAHGTSKHVAQTYLRMHRTCVSEVHAYTQRDSREEGKRKGDSLLFPSLAWEIIMGTKQDNTSGQYLKLMLPICSNQS